MSGERPQGGGSDGTMAQHLRVRLGKRRRTSTEWREEMRPQIASLGEKLIKNEKANSEKESKFGRFFALLVGTLNLVGLVDIEKILPVLEKGKEDIRKRKKELISFVRRTKRRINEEEEERVTLEWLSKIISAAVPI